jgi:hypothetical protein
MSFNCGIPAKNRGIGVRAFIGAAALWLLMASSVRSQEAGYSYLRMDVNGHTISNFVPNEKYSRGWLEILGVQVKSPSPITHPLSQPELKADTNKTVKPDSDGWTELSVALRSGRSGPGKLRFAAGDSGGMEPLFDAIKQKSVIPQAELDLYIEDTGKFVGRFTIKKIRILSLEDIQASACGAYMITVSVQSIAKE